MSRVILSNGRAVPKIRNKTCASKRYNPLELSVQPFGSLSSWHKFMPSFSNSRTRTLGFRRPYGSSSFGLNTLGEPECQRGASRTGRSRNRLDLAVHLGSREVRPRGALGDHLGMNAICNSFLHCIHESCIVRKVRMIVVLARLTCRSLLSS